MYEIYALNDEYLRLVKKYKKNLKNSKVYEQKIDASENVNLLLKMEEKTGLSYEDVLLFVNTFLQIVKEHMLEFDIVKLKNFGTFMLFGRKKRINMERDDIWITNHYKIMFRFEIAKEFRQLLKETFTSKSELQ